MKILKPAAFFAVGGAGYVLLELLWRRRSHISMFCAGGTCFLLLGQLRNRSASVLNRALLGSAVITSVELLTGLIVNRNYKIWDYRKAPLNFKGQICPQYCLLWLPVSLGGMWLYGYLDRQIGKK